MMMMKTHEAAASTSWRRGFRRTVHQKIRVGKGRKERQNLVGEGGGRKAPTTYCSMRINLG